MSQCGLMKNGIFMNVHGKIDYCCEMPSDGNYRPTFSCSEYDEFKKHGKANYELSKTEWVSGCSGCQYNEEVNKKPSLRTISDTFLKSPDENDESIKHAIINTGNICNLACRMCNGGSSSKWVSYTKIKKHMPAEAIDNFMIRSNWIYDNENMDVLYSHVLTDKLILLSLAGGEPTQNHRALEMITYLAETGYSKNVVLCIITNGTLLLTDKWRKHFDSFNRLELTISMDGTFDNYEYIRQDADWDLVINNVKDYQELVKNHHSYQSQLCVAYCWQALNAHKFLYDQKWFKDNNIDFHYQTVHDPDYATLECIHPILREKYGISKAYHKEYNEENFKKLLKVNGWMDRLFKKEGALEEQNPDFFDTKLFPFAREIYNGTT